METELLAQKDLLREGLLSFKPNTKESLEKFKKSSEVGESWKEFVVKLSGLVGMEEGQAWELLCNYLASEFRGTSASLATLLKEESQARPLLLDIWHFHRAERLYLLQVLKDILTFFNDRESVNQPVFETVLEAVEGGEGLRGRLVAQLEGVMAEAAPRTASLGALAPSCRKSWIHFNLREQSELLQLLLLTIHQTGSRELDDFTALSAVFSSHEFGSKQQFRSEIEEQSAGLVEGVGHLEAACLVLLMDLSSIPSASAHPLFPATGTAPALERFISGLGNLAAHGPPMLAYMLGTYLAQGQEGLATSTRFGEAAIAGNVLRTLLATLRGDFTRSLVSDILHSLIYSLAATLVEAFDPVSLGLGLDTHALVVQLLGHRQVAEHFWKVPSEGLGIYVDSLKANFPYEHRPLMEVATALARSSPSSCSALLPTLSSLPTFTDSADLLPPSARALGNSTVELTAAYFPYPGTQSVCLPAGTRGVLSPSGTTVTWRPEAPCNGWQLMLADCGHLATQATSGAGAVSPNCLARVTSTAALVAAILATDASLAPQLAQLTSSLLHCLAIVTQLPSPPLALVAAVTDIFSSLAASEPGAVLARLGRAPLLPRLGRDGALQPGITGMLLARQESVAGEYPALLAFLRLATKVAGQDAAAAAIVFVLQEVVPHFSKWRYEAAGDRERVALLALTAVLRHTDTEEGLHLVAGDQGLARALLQLAATGDRTIQTLLESQTNWEVGRGADLAAVVHLALTVLHRLATASPLLMAGPVGAAIRAPPHGSAPHLLLTLAHYTYFFHLPELAIAAVQLLAAVARDTSVCGTSPVSLLACLAQSAASVKEMLLTRLESSTEDIRLKIAIVTLLTSCVEQQPGMVQLLMDLNTEVKVVEGPGPGERGEGAAPLVGEGCLAPVLRLLAQCSTEEVTSLWLDLHLGIVCLVDALWSRGRILAAQHLKDQPGFWADLCRPLTHPRAEHAEEARGLKLRAFVLRVVSHEIYTWTGDIAPGLAAVIEEICHERSGALTSWCDVEDGEAASDASTFIDCDPDENVPLFLLSSWRAFLLVLSKDSPSSLSPAACRTVFGATTSKLSSCLAQAPPPPRLTVILAETAVVLARRWRTKCTTTMEAWCGAMAGLLEQLDTSWAALHPRARLAVLGLGLASTGISHCKLEQEEEVLGSWLAPALALLATTFRELERSLGAGQAGELQAPELALALLHALVTRLPPSAWLPALHRNAALALLLSAVGACCRARVAPSFTLSTLSLLLEVASAAQGASALLVHDLARDVWLPLSSLPADAAWQGVRQAGLHLAGSLVRVARRPAVGTAVTLAALTCERLCTDLLSPRQDLAHLPRAAAAASFVSCLAPYTAAWRADHPASLLMLYRATCRLLHTAPALLMRPTLLASLVRKDTPMEEARRVRSLSTSTSCTELEAEVGPETAPSYLLLLDTCHGCLALLSSLSPPLPELLAGTALHDPDRWLLVSFISFLVTAFMPVT